MVAHIAYLFSEHISIRRSINLTVNNAGGNIRKMEPYSTLYSKTYIPRDKFKKCNTIPCQIHPGQYYEESVTKSAIFAMIKRRKDSKGLLITSKFRKKTLSGKNDNSAHKHYYCYHYHKYLLHNCFTKK